jgi:hypothetical protein
MWKVDGWSRGSAQDIINNILKGGTYQQGMSLSPWNLTRQLCEWMKNRPLPYSSADEYLDALTALLIFARQHGYLDFVTDLVKECGVLGTLGECQYVVSLFYPTIPEKAKQIIAVIRGMRNKSGGASSCCLLLFSVLVEVHYLSQLSHVYC